MGSLLSIPLHRLELISFSATPGNKSCHGNTFLFLGLANIFMGSLLSIPLHRLELISFSTIPGNKCYHGNTLCVLGLKIFLGLHSKPLHALELISFSATPSNKSCHGNTFFSFYVVHIKSPEEDLYDKVTSHSIIIHNDLARLLAHKMVDKYKSYFSP